MNPRLKKIICSFLPLRKTIVFESNPEFSCNTLPVYQEMMRRGIDKEYQIYWLVEDKNKYKDDTSGVKYLNYSERGFDRLKWMYILATSKALIFSNRFLNKYKKTQLVVNLMHGSPLKRTPGYTEDDTCDFVISEASFFNEMVSEGLNVPIEKIIPLGFPRNDTLKTKHHVLSLLKIDDEKKVIVWMPTFRKNKNSGFVFGEINRLGVPLLDSIEKFERLNTSLKENNVQLIIKLHPVEDTTDMKLNVYSNIRFLTDSEFERNGVTVYELLSDSDALLTDYSSVYYDYLLMDKPIGLVVDDLKEFTERIGFYYGDYRSFVKGSYIESLVDFIAFIENAGNDVDPNKADRQWARKRYCQYTDYQSTKRVTDFIMEKLEMS